MIESQPAAAWELSASAAQQTHSLPVYCSGRTQGRAAATQHAAAARAPPATVPNGSAAVRWAPVVLHPAVRLLLHLRRLQFHRLSCCQQRHPTLTLLLLQICLYPACRLLRAVCCGHHPGLPQLLKECTGCGQAAAAAAAQLLLAA